MTTPVGSDPVVFKTPTLGNPVRLGELYDQRSGQFLGVQLYAEDSIQVAETDIRNTDLSLSLSTTLEDKANLLDIYAKLSLEVMSGAVSVSGSAAYVKDTKSNTKEQAFALALKMRLKERRILFAEDAMGRNVLRIASEDYIANGAATHFVSAIVYGGNVVVNLVARQSELDTDEKIEGALELKFNKLKGAISLDAEVKVTIKDTFKSLDDKFDVVIHGDVALDQVPIDPKDVLEIIPNAATLITDGGGVPISVTLQPIPKKLVDARKIYEIEARIVDSILKAFSELDDIRSRFAVLVDGTKSVEAFVPELARVARATAVYFANEHGKLLYKLRNFLDDYQHGRDPGDDWKGEDAAVLKEARKLRSYHLELDHYAEEDEVEVEGEGDDADEEPSSDYYNTTLVGLEYELLKFQYFVADLQKSRDSANSLEDAYKKQVFLSSLDAISRAIRHQNMIPLFAMSPFTPKQPTKISSAEKLTPDLYIIEFLAVLRENVEYFNSSRDTARVLYAETLENLKSRLPGLINPNDTLKGPLVIGNVNVDGTLSWSEPPPTTELLSKLCHKSPTGDKRGEVSYGLSGVNGKRSFTFQVRAKTASVSGLVPESIVCDLKTTTNKPFLTIQVAPLLVRIWRNSSIPVIIKSNLPLEKQFVLTLTQDFGTRQWFLYIGNSQVGDAKFTGASELLDESEEIQVVYPNAPDMQDVPESDKKPWWMGEVLGVRGFSFAFTQEQLDAELNKVENTLW